MPMASTRPNKVNMLTVKPSAAMAAKAPMMVTGTVVAGTSMARQSCRNTTITIRTRIPASNSVLYTSRIDASTNLVVSSGISYVMPSGNDSLSSLHRGLDLFGHCQGVGTGELIDADVRRRLPFVLVELIVRLGSQFHARDIFEQRESPAVTRAHDNVLQTAPRR